MMDVAKSIGVSPSTVSLVLKDDPRITVATRERVRKAIRRLNYHPNRMARTLALQHTQMLAILIPEVRHVFADVYFGEIVSGIYAQADKLGYKVLLEVATNEFIERKEYLRLFDEKFVDGLLFIGAHSRYKFLEDLVDGTRPMVLVNNYSKELDLNYVVSNCRQGARQAAQHLIQLGHQHIGFIASGLWGIQTCQDILEAFVEVLTEHDMTLDQDRIIDGGFSEEGGMKAVEQLISQNPQLTAIFALNDKMALGAIKMLTELGFRVPQDIAVAGFDDIPQASFSVPGLTTVHQPLYEIGQQSCDRLIKLIDHKVKRVREVVPVRLVVRESCGAAFTFTYVDPKAIAVSVAGQFNNWDPTANPMKKNSAGVWSATIALKPGKQPYKFFVDGNWQLDSKNPISQVDGEGTLNSIKIVTP
jgi:LacI family transcriptional regulator